MNGMDEWQAIQNEKIRLMETISNGIAEKNAEIVVLRTALQFIVDGYANPDVNHVDYRVKVYAVALAALSALSPSHSETGKP